MRADELEILELISRGEDLTLEFKSDRRCLPDRELIAAVVALANTEGGIILLGVEDSGEITGLHPNHLQISGLPALIANKTNPSIAVTVEAVPVGGKAIAKINVPKCRQLVSTSDGLLQRRRLMVNGKPEAVPFYPHEFIQRQSSLGLRDPSAEPIMDMTGEDLNPLERYRLREAIRTYGGDQALSSLADHELDGALGLTINIDGVMRPTVAGLLMLGKEPDIRSLTPSHEVAFQVLYGVSVRVNEFFRKPLLRTFEEVEQLFRTRVEEEEIQDGLFRIPVPNYDLRAFREAFVNALVHRDYSRLGAVHVKLDQDGLTISSPGGFVEGVTLENILVAPPRSRNPLLADIIKRIGLAERTGRGIDRIFEGMLRYGRPAPDYSMSNAFTVSVQMLNTDADFKFLNMILEHEKKHGVMPIDSLIILSRLREERRLSISDFAKAAQKTESAIRGAIEKLCEAGLVDAFGTGRGRTYTLSAKVYQQTGMKAAYVRQMGFEPIQQEQMVMNYIDHHGSIKRSEAAELCGINPYQASRLLRRMVEAGSMRQKGRGKGTFYERA